MGLIRRFTRQLGRVGGGESGGLYLLPAVDIYGIWEQRGEKGNERLCRACKNERRNRRRVGYM